MPPTSQPDQEPLGDLPPKTRSNTYELVEGRTNYRMWVPRYINGQFASRIGDGGIAVYSSLAWWLTSDAPHHRPTLTEIGQHAGCSRATVWRVLKVLVANGLVELLPAIESTGRRAHRIRLVHPPEVCPSEASDGTEFAGGSNLSAPSAQDERAARSNRARGALNPSAPSGLNKDLNVCEGENHTHTPDPPSAGGKPTSADVKKFSEAWMAALPPGTANWRADHAEEAAWCAGLLLSRGWTLQALLMHVSDPQRSPHEWPREYAARLGPCPPKAARTPAKVVEEAQRRSQEAERLSAEQQTAEWHERMKILRERLARSTTLPPPADTDRKK
jgi:hypothetical protein